MELGIRAWFGVQDTPQRRSRPPETNETNGKVDSRQAATGEGQRARGPTVLSHRKSDVKVQVQEVGEPKTHMGRHWPPAPDPPGLCDGTSSISRKVVYFVSPSFLFPCSAAGQHHPQPASSCVCCSTHDAYVQYNSAAPHCTITLDSCCGCYAAGEGRGPRWRRDCEMR